jgi:hypothetical protein
LDVLNAISGVEKPDLIPRQPVQSGKIVIGQQEENGGRRRTPPRLAKVAAFSGERLELQRIND